jgi:hypothetical protein
MARADDQMSGTIAANGTGQLVHTCTGRQNQSVDSVSINAPGVGGAAVGKIFRNSQFICFFIATADTPEGVPVPLSPGQKLIIQWTGAVVGANIDATVWYDDGEG